MRDAKISGDLDPIMGFNIEIDRLVRTSVHVCVNLSCTGLRAPGHCYRLSVFRGLGTRALECNCDMETASRLMANSPFIVTGKLISLGEIYS